MSVSFRGGIKIRFNGDKIRSLDSKPVMPCSKLYFPLTSRSGVSYVPVVKIGDSVSLGQRIAFSADNWELPMHSSVSGTVEEITECPSPVGKVKTIVIRNDELYTPIDTKLPTDDYTSITKEQLIEILQNSGVAELPTGDFLCGDALISLPPKYLIVNAAEGEPYTAAASRRIAENADDIIEGCKIVQHLLGIKTIYLAIESDFREGIDAVAGAIRFNQSMNIITIKPKYPQKRDEMLVKAVLGQAIPRGKLPIDIGCLIISPEVLYHISNVVKTGMPVTEVMVSIGGNVLSSADNYRASLGTPISALTAQTDSAADDPNKIIVNSLVNGEELPSKDVPLTKDISSVILLSESSKKAKIPPPPTQSKTCIHCGKCVIHCPAGLLPFKISSASINYKPSKAMKYSSLDCLSCGICSYVCPSGIPLAENIASINDTIERLYSKEEAMHE